MTPQPAPDVTDQSTANVGHLYCCDPARALCGEALDPAIVSGPLRDGDEVDCRVCVLADEMDTPCGARFCRLRMWWRRQC